MRSVISAALFPGNDGFDLVSVVRDGNSARLKKEFALCLHFEAKAEGLGFFVAAVLVVADGAGGGRFLGRAKILLYNVKKTGGLKRVEYEGS